MSAPEFVRLKGSLKSWGHSSQPLHCFGMVVATLSCAHMEGMVALEVAESPDGEWFCPPDGNGPAQTRQPRALAFCPPNDAPFYARVKFEDARSWSRPVHFELRSVKPPEPEPEAPDPRAIIVTGSDAQRAREVTA